ncbi:MAG: AAA family ATPase [Actinomycetes bacterium]
MRPMRIEFSAFGPFPGTWEIDFTKLSGHGLFLITGPTGAGKTTVLDAMVFALYGEAAGARGKHADRLRSDFATPATTTSVTFEFEIQGRQYRIDRSPSYPRPGLKTPHPASVALSERDGTTWKPVSTRIADVKSEVTRIIGLDADQFQQVILLPQGRFAEVLRADSKDRLKLLRALFDTGRFLDAVEILRQESTRRSDAVKDAERDVEHLFDAVLDDWCAVITEAGDDAAATLGVEFAEDGSPFAPETMDAAALTTLDEQATAMVAGLDSAAKAANKAYDTAKALADAAEATAQLWDERAELRRESETLAAVADDDAARELVLVQAEAANGLTAMLRTTSDARTAEEAAAVAVDAAGRGIAAALGDDSPLEEGRIAALLAEQRTIEQTARDALEQFDTARAHRDAERRERDSATAKEREREQLAAELEKVQEELPARRADAQAAETAAAGVDAAVTAEQAATDRVSEINAGITIDRQIGELVGALDAAEQATTAKKAALESTRSRLLSGLAARLADGLEAGVACPTCGSIEHPHLAVAPRDAATEDDVSAAEHAYEAARSAGDTIVRDRTALEAKRATLPPVDELEAATARAADATAKVADLRGLAAGADTHRAAVDAADRFIASNTPKVAALTGEVASAVARADAAAATATDAEARATGFAPDTATARLRRDAAAHLIEALSDLSRLQHELTTASATHAAQRRTLDTELAARGFADDAEAHAAAMDPDAVVAERSAIAARASRRTEVGTLLTDFAKRDIPDDRPDPTELLAARDEAHEARELAVEARGTASVAATAIREARKGLSDRLAKVEAAIAAAETARTVYSVASGNVSPKIDLESWVCSAYLERVTQQANHHLVEMTGGQYRLQLGRTTDGRSRGGLDLDVFDLHTGATRSVDTLSGGETFMASLALALGLAEVVAGQQNLMLDALFIDEGFGSLDADTLDRATEVLHRLQTAGRMVGVITHVTEMQKALPTGIAVTKTDEGSTLTVEYPDA